MTVNHTDKAARVWTTEAGYEAELILRFKQNGLMEFLMSGGSYDVGSPEYQTITGYVKVPPTHGLYGKRHDDILKRVFGVWRLVDYSGEAPQQGTDKGDWWFGFGDPRGLLTTDECVRLCEMIAKTVEYFKDFEGDKDEGSEK